MQNIERELGEIRSFPLFNPLHLHRNENLDSSLLLKYSEKFPPIPVLLLPLLSLAQESLNTPQERISIWDWEDCESSSCTYQILRPQIRGKCNIDLNQWPRHCNRCHVHFPDPLISINIIPGWTLCRLRLASNHRAYSSPMNVVAH